MSERADSNGRRRPARGVDAPRERSRFRTRAVHAGAETGDGAWPLSEPISLSAVYACRDPAIADARSAADPPLPNYGRDGTPNVRALERAVAELEGADDAHAVASGMAAIAMVLLTRLAAGRHVVASADCYSDARRLLADELPRFGVRCTLVDMTDRAAVDAAIEADTALIYAETIANPSMKLTDVAALAATARRRALLLCIDNTFATPVLCRPLRHGADLVVHSATKYLGGHHDLTAGVVAGRRDLIDGIRRGAVLYGPTLSPFDAWLALRGMRTLAPRVAWMSATAQTVAEFLAAHPAVAAVRYPGSPRHPQADLARRLLPDGAGGMLAFDLVGGWPAAERLIRGLRLIPYALSFGGVSTTVCIPPSADRHAGAAGAIRMSVGLEAADDIIADLAQALAGVALTPNPSPAAAGVGRRSPQRLLSPLASRLDSSPLAHRDGRGSRG